MTTHLSDTIKGPAFDLALAKLAGETSAQQA
jgi:hypothetical protein